MADAYMHSEIEWTRVDIAGILVRLNELDIAGILLIPDVMRIEKDTDELGKLM